MQELYHNQWINIIENLGWSREVNCQISTAISKGRGADFGEPTNEYVLTDCLEAINSKSA